MGPHLRGVRRRGRWRCRTRQDRLLTTRNLDSPTGQGLPDTESGATSGAGKRDELLGACVRALSSAAGVKRTSSSGRCRQLVEHGRVSGSSSCAEGHLKRAGTERGRWRTADTVRTLLPEACRQGVFPTCGHPSRSLSEEKLGAAHRMLASLAGQSNSLEELDP